MTLPALRSQFPAALRAAYLNAAAASPLSHPVHAAIAAYHDEALETGDRNFARWLERKEDARADLARLCGAGRDEVAFTGSTSHSVHWVGQLLRARGVTEVVTLEDEFPSTTLPLLNLGLVLRVVCRAADGTYPIDTLEAAVTERTGAVILSAVQYASGYRIPLPPVAALCRARGLLLAVNVIQALGQVPLDMTALGADFFCGASHKWLMGGYGVGFLAVRRSLLRENPLPIAGWLSTERPMELNNLVGAQLSDERGVRVAKGARFRDDASALEAGIMAWGPLLGLQAALEQLHQIGIPTLRAHIQGLQIALRGRLRSAGFRPNGPDDPELSSGICVFPIDGDPGEAARALAERGVIVSPRGGGLRVATHGFNDEEDLDRLFAAFKAVGVRPQGWREGQVRF